MMDKEATPLSQMEGKGSQSCAKLPLVVSRVMQLANATPFPQVIPTWRAPDQVESETSQLKPMGLAWPEGLECQARTSPPAHQGLEMRPQPAAEQRPGCTMSIHSAYSQVWLHGAVMCTHCHGVFYSCLLIVCLHICPALAKIHVGVGGQCTAVISLLPPCEFWGLNSGLELGSKPLSP